MKTNTPPSERGAEITQAYLSERLDYDEMTGIFHWKHSSIRSNQWNSHFAGKKAGGPNSGGYTIIGLDGSYYLASRLAWLYVTGKWPKAEIDHRDTDVANDRFTNLRPATRPQNCSNRNMRSDNTSGRKGVSWNKKNKKWVAMIMAHGKVRYLGSFTELDDAARAYAYAADELHGEFARVPQMAGA